MNVFSLRATGCIVVLAAIYLAAAAAAAQTATSRIVSSANKFLATLDAEKRQGVLYSFDDEKQRATWSNLPTTFVPRGGMSLKNMNPAQRAAAMDLVSAALSPRGFEKVQQIMGGGRGPQTQGQQSAWARQQRQPSATRATSRGA